jgi:REP element-mobilizing transposase RayT
MPNPGMRWRHVTISTYNSWLPDDPRGFRSKKHRIHSSGDYRNPPPAGEHSRLHRYTKQISGQPVVIPADARSIVGKAILKKLDKLGYRILVLAVAGMHAHMLVELPDDDKTVKGIIGQCKTVSSHSVRKKLPGRVWAIQGSFIPVDDPVYQKNIYYYVLRQEDAWIWSYKDGMPDD